MNCKGLQDLPLPPHWLPSLNNKSSLSSLYCRPHSLLAVPEGYQASTCRRASPYDIPSAKKYNSENYSEDLFPNPFQVFY